MAKQKFTLTFAEANPDRLWVWERDDGEPIRFIAYDKERGIVVAFTAGVYINHGIHVAEEFWTLIPVVKTYWMIVYQNQNGEKWGGILFSDKEKTYSLADRTPDALFVKPIKIEED